MFNRKRMIRGTDGKKLQKIIDIVGKSEKHKYHFVVRAFPELCDGLNGLIKRKDGSDGHWGVREALLKKRDFYLWDYTPQTIRQRREIVRFLRNLKGARS